MKDRLPEHIEPLRLARSHRLLQGHLPLSRMTRLAATLADTDGDVEVELEFDVDSNGVPRLQGRMRCELSLHCQRCMQAFMMPVDTGFSLAVVESEAEIDKLGEEYEPLLLNDALVSVLELIEDELLLGLPIVPKHQSEDCNAEMAKDSCNTEPAAAAEEPAEGKNPFAVLADLKSK